MLKRLHIEKHRLFFLFLFIYISKFILVRYFLFKEFQPLKTLTLELMYLVFLLAIIELIKSERIKWIAYWLLNIIITTLLVALVLYFKYSGQIVSIIMLQQLGQVGTVKDSVFKLLNPVYLLLMIDLIILLIIRIKQKFKELPNNAPINHLFLIPLIIVSFVSISAVLMHEKDELIVNAGHTAEHSGLFTYEIVCVIQLIQEPESLSKKEAATILEDVAAIKQTTTVADIERQHFGELAGKNVISIQLEAFQNFVIGLDVNGQEITPFLNKLVQNSLYFKNTFHQIAAGSTSDAEFMSNTSLYSITPGATTKILGNRAIPSFPKLLKEKGYTTMTMHANDVEFWNRYNLYQALGFDTYYDLTYFGEQQNIGIGPSDRVLFDKSVPIFTQLNDANEPFYAQLVTLTSHHPFVMPDVLKVLDLPVEYDETIIGDYLQVIHFVDKQLEFFFEELAKNGVLDDTIVVLYGDHQALQLKNLDEDESALMNQLLGREYTIVDQLNIPFIMHAEGTSFTQEIDTIAGQVDIMPTISNLLGVSLKNHVHFGQDLLNDTNNLIGVRYYLPYGSFINQAITSVVFTNYKDSTLYSMDTRLTIPYENTYLNDYKRIMQLLKLNDKYLRSLPARADEIIIEQGS
jgi:lipoteichoic acid synthase